MKNRYQKISWSITKVSAEQRTATNKVYVVYQNRTEQVSSQPNSNSGKAMLCNTNRKQLVRHNIYLVCIKKSHNF